MAWTEETKKWVTALVIVLVIVIIAYYGHHYWVIYRAYHSKGGSHGHGHAHGHGHGHPNPSLPVMPHRPRVAAMPPGKMETFSGDLDGWPGSGTFGNLADTNPYGNYADGLQAFWPTYYEQPNSFYWTRS